MRFRLLLIFCLCIVIACSHIAVAQVSVASLAKALAAEDFVAIQSAVAEARGALGERAGTPEEPDVYQRVPRDLALLSEDQANRGFSRDFAKLDSIIWWKVGIDPTKATSPLRGPASVLSGNMAAVRAKLEGADRSLAIATEAAEFLMWAQEQAGSGVFPFPAARGTSTARAMEVATRFLDKAEKAGKLDSVVRNGWAFDDLGDGGLQFDNGECGVAMFELYELTNDARYLASACRAAEWAAARPLCTNWNYNSFSVELLSKAYSVIGERRYLDAAIHKAQFGVMPGQLTDGPHAGRWIDPHNARPAYHYIMMRGLTRLAATMPTDDPVRNEVIRCLTRGLKTRNKEIVELGVMNKDKAIESLLLVNSVFENDQKFLDETHSRAALQVIGKMVSEEYRRGKSPLGPREWGLFLEAIASGQL